MNTKERSTLDQHTQLMTEVLSMTGKEIADKHQQWSENTHQPEQNIRTALVLSELFKLDQTLKTFQNEPSDWITETLKELSGFKFDNPELNEYLKELTNLHFRMFTLRTGRDLSTIWFGAAVKQGEDNLTVKTASAMWNKAMKRVRNDNRASAYVGYYNESDLEHNRDLPKTKPVEHDDIMMPGWEGVELDQKAGHLAILDELAIQNAGRDIQRQNIRPLDR